MQIGIPKEIKEGERRVALTPMGVKNLVGLGACICIEHGAGIASGFSDTAYQAAGALLVSREQAWASDLVVKVKEPLAEEYDYLRPNLVLFTYLHLAAAPELADVLLANKVRAIAYETVALDDGSLPLLMPMSQVAGRVAMLMAAEYLRADISQQVLKGDSAHRKGLLLGGVPDVEGGQVTILGAGHVGMQAAHVAHALGAHITLLDCRENKLKLCEEIWQTRLTTAMLSEQALHEALPNTDVLIGAALVTGEHAPQLLKGSDIAMMAEGSVFMDVAIDQGGVSETSRVTSYSKPVYIYKGVWHCCLPNFPACVPKTSTYALELAILPYLKMIVELGLQGAIAASLSLKRGINTWNGKLMHQGVAHALDKEYMNE